MQRHELRVNGEEKCNGIAAALVLVVVFTIGLTRLGVAADSTTRANNLIYIELGGNSGLFSVCYDRYILPQVFVKCGVGWSIQFRDTMVNGVNVYDYPPGAHILLAYVLDNREQVQFDAGAGLYHNLSIDHPEEIPFDDLRGRSLLTTLLGLRFSSPHGGFEFRFALVGFSDLLAYRVLFGLDFGYRL